MALDWWHEGWHRWFAHPLGALTFNGLAGSMRGGTWGGMGCFPRLFHGMKEARLLGRALLVSGLSGSSLGDYLDLLPAMRADEPGGGGDAPRRDGVVLGGQWRLGDDGLEGGVEGDGDSLEGLQGRVPREVVLHLLLADPQLLGELHLGHPPSLQNELDVVLYVCHVPCV